MKTLKSFLVSNLYQKYLLPGLPFTALIEPMLAYMKSNAEIWAGEIGNFEGAYFIESPRMYNATDGASSARVFRTIIAGQQALAEAVAEEPHVVIGPVTDKLMRFRPIGWYGVLGFSRYREDSLYRIESTSSINNA